MGSLILTTPALRATSYREGNERLQFQTELVHMQEAPKTAPASLDKII
jgi:hypothetical protein